MKEMTCENVLSTSLKSPLVESRFGKRMTLILMFIIGIFILLTISSPIAQFAYDESEAGNAAVIWTIREGLSVYSLEAYNGEQMITFTYSPLYFHLSGWISKWLALNFFSTVRLSRALGVAFVCLIWWMIYLIARKLGASRREAVAGLAIAISSHICIQWLPRIGPDAPMLALQLASIAAYLYLPAKYRRGYLLAILPALSFTAKQVALLAIAVIVLDLLIKREVKLAISSTIWFSMYLFLIFLIGNTLTEGGFQSMMFLQKGTTFSNGFIYYVKHVMAIVRATDLVPIFLALVLCSCLLPFREKITVAEEYFLMSVVWVALLSGKEGASSAYWTPAVVGASLVTARALAAFRLKGELLAQQMVFNGILCFALLQLVFFAPGFVNGHLRGDPVQMARKREIVERLHDFVKPQALVGGRAPDVAIAAGMRFVANDWSLFTFPSSPFFPRLNQALLERRVDALLVYPGEMDSYPGYKIAWRGQQSFAGELVILTPSRN